MMKWFALPTWILTRLFTPFLPAEHPWKKRRFTLEDWALGQTSLCQWFDVVFWWSLIGFGAIGFMLTEGR